MTTLVGGAVGGAAIQSVLGPLFGQVHDRRGLRAKVLEGLTAVESARWVSGDDRSEFRAALAQLRSAALVAGVVRELVDVYVLAASAAFGESLRGWEQTGDPEGGGISLPLGAYVTSCAEALTAYVWHPHLRRLDLFRTRRRLRKGKARIAQDAAAESHIDWDRVWVPR